MLLKAVDFHNKKLISENRNMFDKRTFLKTENASVYKTLKNETFVYSGNLVQKINLVKSEAT